MSINWVNILTISFPLQRMRVYESVCFFEWVCMWEDSLFCRGHRTKPLKHP